MTKPNPLQQWLRDEVIHRDRLRNAVLGTGSTEDAIRALDEFAQRMDQIAQHSTEVALMVRLMSADLRGEPVSPADAQRWEQWADDIRQEATNTDSE